MSRPNQPKSNQSNPLSEQRVRLTVDVPPAVLALLDHYCEATGLSRSGVLLGLLVERLPALNAHAKELKNRAREVIQTAKK
jgi:hypothetical protein